MYLVTSGEMKEIDRTTIENYGVPPAVLMENAGANVTQAVLNEYGPVFLKKACVFCGGGNNGGDGFVIARHLKSEGALVKVFFTGDKDALTQESKANHEICGKYGIEIAGLKSNSDLEKSGYDVMGCDIIIDALIGAGLKKDIEGFMARLIVYLNNMGKYTVAVDVPSGIDPDTGDIKGVAIYADMTVTFGLPKIGITIFPGLEYVGKLVVADINIPQELLSKPRPNVLMTPEIVGPMLPYRHPNANKGHFGPILIIGGSRGMGGAVALTAKAALKAGAGLTTLAVPEGLHDSIKAGTDEAIVVSMKETENGSLSIDNFDRIMELAKNAKVVAIGPGMGRDRETQALARRLIEGINKPIVVDADGINAVSEDKKCLKNIKKDVIFTPHIGEMSGLTGIKIEDIIKDKISVLRDFVGEYRVNVLLKDGRSIVADAEKNIYINTTGNSGMATPGSGDALTGVVSAFLAHGMPAAQAGIVGNFIHGMAGDLLLKEMSGEGITASDIIDKIPVAIKNLRK
jgi:ADP-dependent NAD(P)H-hydrate dehydratase / NAD(P)H-hydrate epimerase